MHPAALPCGSDKDLLDGSSQSWMCVTDGEPHTFESPCYQAAQEGEPKCPVLRRSQVKTEHFPFSGAFHADGDHKGHALNASVFPHLGERGIQPHIGILLLQGTVLKGLYDLVELFTDTGDLAFADAIQTQRLHQFVDFARTDPMHIRLLDHAP